MATVLTDDANYTAIADSIRAKNGTDTEYYPSEMAAAIDALELTSSDGTVVDNTALNNHITDKDNPHEVTAEQIGAYPNNISDYSGDYNDVTDGVWCMMAGCANNPSPDGSVCILYHKDWDANFATQEATALSGKTYHRVKSSGTWFDWEQIVDTNTKIFNLINKNILHNGNFLNPINSRGQTEYIGSGYHIDRWRGGVSTDVTTLTENGLKIENKRSSEENTWFRQYLDGYLSKGTYTLSALVTDVGSAALYLSDSNGNAIPQTMPLSVGLNTMTVDISDDTVNRVQGTIGYQSSVTISAIKLERGSIQTLAEQDSEGNWILLERPVEKGIEMVRCSASTADSSDEYANKVSGIGSGSFSTTVLFEDTIASPTDTMTSVGSFSEPITNFDFISVYIDATNTSGTGKGSSIYIGDATNAMYIAETAYCQNYMGNHLFAKKSNSSSTVEYVCINSTYVRKNYKDGVYDRQDSGNDVGQVLKFEFGATELYVEASTPDNLEADGLWITIVGTKVG